MLLTIFRQAMHMHRVGHQDFDSFKITAREASLPRAALWSQQINYLFQLVVKETLFSL